MLIFVRKSGRISEYGIGTSKFDSTVVHHLNKSVNGTTDLFCNLKSNIIGRCKHDRIQTLFYSKDFIQLSGNTCTTVRDTGNTGRGHSNLIAQLCIFQSQKRGHNFYCSTGVKNLVHVFGINGSLCTVFHDHCSCGGYIRTLWPAGDAVGRNGRGLRFGRFFGCQDRCLEYQCTCKPKSHQTTI